MSTHLQQGSGIITAQHRGRAVNWFDLNTEFCQQKSVSAAKLTVQYSISHNKEPVKSDF